MGTVLGSVFNKNTLPWWLTGLGAATGAFENKGGTTTQQTSGTSQSTQGGVYTGTEQNALDYNLSPQQQTAENLFLQKLIDQAGGDFSKTVNAYRQSGLSNIQSNYDAKNQMLTNLMKQRGLSNSPAAVTPQLGLNSQRMQELSALNASVPMVKQQLQQQAIQNLIQGFVATPFNRTSTTNRAGSTGATSNVNTTGNATVTTPSNIMGGLLAGAAGVLGTLYNPATGKIGGPRSVNPGAVNQDNLSGVAPADTSGVNPLSGINWGSLGYPGATTPPIVGSNPTGDTTDVSSNIDWGQVLQSMGIGIGTTPTGPAYDPGSNTFAYGAQYGTPPVAGAVGYPNPYGNNPYGPYQGYGSPSYPYS